MKYNFYNGDILKNSAEATTREIFARVDSARRKARKLLITSNKPHVLYSIHRYNNKGELSQVDIFVNKELTDIELDRLIKDNPDAYFDVLHAGTHKKACEKLVEREKSREIRPITLKEANNYVNTYHRHHKGCVGHKFSIALYEEDRLIGVAIVGRPVSRYLDDGRTCEINRLCTTGGANACSQLYGACARIAQHMGFSKIITYILESESGSSLKASNFVCEGVAGGTHWTGARNRNQDIPHEMKTRWVKIL